LEAAHYSTVLNPEWRKSKGRSSNWIGLFLFFSWQIYFLGWQAASVRDVMAVSRKPPVAEMDQAIETGEAEKSVERPRPPDFPCDE
jgi:hypothetical protein